MRINLVLELMDTPGQLVKALEPISSLGANLVTVIHKRDYKNEKGNVPVQLTIEGEHEDLKKVVNRFEELGFSIIEMDGVVKKEKITTIFFGHIVEEDLLPIIASQFYEIITVLFRKGIIMQKVYSHPGICALKQRAHGSANIFTIGAILIRHSIGDMHHPRILPNTLAIQMCFSSTIFRRSNIPTKQNTLPEKLYIKAIKLPQNTAARSILTNTVINTSYAR